jgi:hypothetical protein
MSDADLWYRIGFAVERARTGADDARSASALERLRDRLGLMAAGATGKEPPALVSDEAEERRGKDLALPSTDAIMLAAYTSLGVSLLKAWRPRHRPGVVDLLRGGASGAAAALLAEVLRPVVVGELAEEDAGDEELVRAVMAGIGEGLVYAAAIEPRLPGPPSMRGAALGTASYLLAPLGGLARILRPLSPHRRMPVLGALVEDDRSTTRPFVEALLLGIALAVFYGTADSRGIVDDEP